MPARYQSLSAPLPLHITLHGLGDTCQNFGQATGLKAFADQNSFLLAYPCGTSGMMGNGWNAGQCCFVDADDSGFLIAMVREIQKQFKVDASRIYASGFSNGAMMAEKLACESPDMFAAVASVSGVVVVSPGGKGGLSACSSSFAKVYNASTSVLLIHGDDDSTVPWDGQGFLGFPSVPDDFTTWSERNACTDSAHQTLSRGSFSNQVYGVCRGGAVQELVRNHGGGHSWPESDDFHTSQYIVSFFAKIQKEKI